MGHSFTLFDVPLSSPLSRSINDAQPYTREYYEKNCCINSSYQFTSANGNRFTVHYSIPGTTVLPHDPLPPDVTLNSLLTFVHFPPGTFVASDFPFGSKSWWRLQSCNAAPQKHRGSLFPGGGWTARYETEDEEVRRPSRAVNHFSTCTVRESEGDYFPLGKLAVAIRSPLRNFEKSFSGRESVENMTYRCP